jgi:hypothetical protein
VPAIDDLAVNALADAGHVILGPGVEPVTEKDF